MLTINSFCLFSWRNCTLWSILTLPQYLSSLIVSTYQLFDVLPFNKIQKQLKYVVLDVYLIRFKLINNMSTCRNKTVF